MLQVIIVGNLGADAKMQESEGRKFTSFRVAHNERWKDQNGQEHSTTQWVDCTMNEWPKVAEYLKAGTTVAVIGSATLRTYSSEKDRCIKAGMRVQVRNVELIGGAADIIPTRLADKDGVIHTVNKYYNTDMTFATLYDNKGNAYTTDANGWVQKQMSDTSGQSASGQSPQQGEAAPGRTNAAGSSADTTSPTNDEPF